MVQKIAVAKKELENTFDIAELQLPAELLNHPILQGVSPQTLTALSNRFDVIKAPRGAMVGQGHAAVRAFQARATLAAEDHDREPAPVEQHHRLFLAGKTLGQRRTQRLAQDDVGAVTRVLTTHVDDPHRGKRAILHAGRESEKTIPSFCSVGGRLQ